MIEYWPETQCLYIIFDDISDNMTIGEVMYSEDISVFNMDDGITTCQSKAGWCFFF